MKLPIFLVLIWVAMAALPVASFAEKADSGAPMHIEADALRYDDLQKTSVFTGNVLLTKGSMQIRGQKLEVREDAQGYQFGRVTGSNDALAVFRQKREGLDEFVEGEGAVLEYDGKVDTLTLTQKAQIRRYRGAVLADEISGAVIVYNSVTDKFSVDGSLTREAGRVGTGRVRVMQSPRSDGATTNSNAQSVPGLRVTPRLQTAPSP